MVELLTGIYQTNLIEFCNRWQIQELAVFGSALRDDFGDDSDIDLLVSFDERAEWGLWAHVQMQYELQTLLGRPVDLLSKRAVERSKNWIRRQEILETAKVIFSAQEVSYA